MLPTGPSAATASLLQTRNVIEGLAVRLFVPKRTDDDIAVLRTIIRDFRQAAQQPRADVDKLAELACSFHRYICFKSGNNVVPLIVNGFHDVNIVLWAQWVRSVGPRAAGDVLEDFLYFVTQGDAEGAIALFDTNTDEFVSRLVDV